MGIPALVHPIVCGYCDKVRAFTWRHADRQTGHTRGCDMCGCGDYQLYYFLLVAVSAASLSEYIVSILFDTGGGISFYGDGGHSRDQGRIY